MFLNGVIPRIPENITQMYWKRRPKPPDQKESFKNNDLGESWTSGHHAGQQFSLINHALKVSCPEDQRFSKRYTYI